MDMCHCGWNVIGKLCDMEADHKQCTCVNVAGMCLVINVTWRQRMHTHVPKLQDCDLTVV